MALVYTDLLELKTYLEIDRGDVAEDTKLRLMIEHATTLINSFLGRNLPPEYKQRTEFYAGTGIVRLPLKTRPVTANPVPLVYLDDAGYFGSASGSFDPGTTALVYGQDFSLLIDQEDGVTSRSGILVRMNALWNKPRVRQVGYLFPFVAPAYGNVKVVYTAGYTTDTLPAEFRLACNVLAARLRYLMPDGMEIGTESYEKRVMGMVVERRDYLMSLVKHILFPFRSWKW